MSSLEMRWNRNQKHIIVKNILKDACKFGLRSSSDLEEHYQLRLGLKRWSEMIKNNWCLLSTLAICLHSGIYSCFLLVASLVVVISTVHRLLLKQLGEWVASERLLERSGINFLNTLGKRKWGGGVFCFGVCWVFCFVFFFFLQWCLLP